MDINSIYVEPFWLWAHVLYWPLLAWVVFHAPWRIVFENDARNAWLATCVVVMLVWQIDMDLMSGVSFHQLGTTVLALMFRWQFAIMSQCLILVGVTLYGDSDWKGFAVNAWVTGIVPISLSYLIWRINEKYLPANYFVYIFVAAFLNAALTMLVVGMFSYGVLLASGFDFSQSPMLKYHQIFLLMMFPEAFLTGMAMTALVIYRPQWVATFSDKRYLNQ